MSRSNCVNSFIPLLTVCLVASGSASLLHASEFTQTNLVSDIPGLAQTTDANLKNPWGISFSPTSPFWISNQVTGNSTLYNGAGKIVPLVVSTPPGGPTGQVFAGGSGFTEPNGGGASVFIFATLGGTIDAWNSGNQTSAVVAATTPNAAFTGLAMANNGSGNFLYAANFAGNQINVFNTNFAPVTTTGTFTDPNLPAGYVPYNIQTINGNLYVEYSQGFTAGAGLGVVSEFDANGNFIKRLISPGGALNLPWGVTLAPAGFGSFGGDLLVGNLGDGQINAFDPTTGAWIGVVSDSKGNAITNDGLWGLAFRTGAGFDPNALYFTAGINGQADGLFGSIIPTPEPASLLVTALGLSLAAAFGMKRSRA